MSTKKELKILIILIIIFAIFTALSVRYARIEIKHYHTNTCMINTCTSTTNECCIKYYLNCHVCYDIVVNYDLNQSNNIYTKTSTINDAHDLCDKTDLLCYYDDRNILETLTLEKLYPQGAIIVVIILSNILLSIIITTIIFAVRMLRNQSVDCVEHQPKLAFELENMELSNIVSTENSVDANPTHEYIYVTKSF